MQSNLPTPTMHIVPLTRRRVILWGLAVALASLTPFARPVAAIAAPAPAYPAGAERHLRLLRSDPGDSSSVAAPRAIRLWFSQRPELAVTTVRLTGAAGTVAVGKGSFGPGAGTAAPVVFPVTGALAAGRYTAAWRTMAPDGHVITGSIAFTVAPPRGA